LKGKVACNSAVAGVPATALAVVPGNVPAVFLMPPAVSIDSDVVDLLLPCASLWFLAMDLIIIYIDTKAKSRHLKKLTCKGTLQQVLIRVYRLEIQSVMLVFSTHAAFDV
jgi:hypothetical protein